MAMVVTFSGSSAFAGNVGVGLNIHLGGPVRTTSVREYVYREPVRPPVVEYAAAGDVDFVYGKPVNIENDVWIGGGAIICPGVGIGARSVIGAGSVVTRDVPPGMLAVGNPCRVRTSGWGRNH